MGRKCRECFLVAFLASHGEAAAEATGWEQQIELGLVAVIVVLALGMLAYRTFRVARDIPDLPGGISEWTRASSRTVVVIGVEGDYRGSTVSLDGELIFGRDRTVCNVMFGAHHAEISLRHCSLRYVSPERVFILRDLNSTNGTFVSGRRLNAGETSVLRPGDQFHLAHSRNRFEVALS